MTRATSANTPLTPPIKKATFDTEMLVVNKIIRHLSTLDPEGRERVMMYLNSRVKSMTTQATLNLEDVS